MMRLRLSSGHRRVGSLEDTPLLPGASGPCADSARGRDGEQAFPGCPWLVGLPNGPALLPGPRRCSREGGPCLCAPQQSRQVGDGGPASTDRTRHAGAPSLPCSRSRLKVGLSGLAGDRSSETPGRCRPPPQDRRSASREQVQGAWTPPTCRVEAAASGGQVASGPGVLGPPLPGNPSAPAHGVHGGPTPHRASPSLAETRPLGQGTRT